MSTADGQAEPTDSKSQSDFKDKSGPTKQSIGRNLAATRGKLEDSINLSHLEKLKQKFKEHDQDDSNGLDIEEFEQAFRSILTRNDNLSKEDMKVMFMKIDTNCDGTVDWDEFCTYMLLEYKERQDMNYVNETPFPNPFRAVSNSHRETIVGIGFLQALNRPRGGKDDQDTAVSYSQTNGRFVTVDVSGHVSLWNTDIQLQKSLVLDGIRSAGKSMKLGKWVLALECLSNVSKIVISTTNRELCFYDISAGNFDQCFVVHGFENTITSLNYWYDTHNHNEAVLVFGDSLGHIGRLIFSSAQSGLFGTDTIKKTNTARRIVSHDIFMGRISGVKLVIQGIHRDWTKKVMYVPNSDSFISCSMDQETSLYFGSVKQTGDKKGTSTFSVYKGVNAFDFSKDYIVSGGLDTVIRVWHYTMNHKPTAMMKGHSATVEHVIVSEHANSIVSVSKDTVIKVWDLKDHVCLQTLSKLAFGVHPVTSTFFHSLNHTLILGSKNFNLGVLERTRKSTVNKINVKSHSKSVRAALYNQNFNQVVSTSYDSMVCVWDLETGEKVIQFSNCHENCEITAMTFDPTHRRLLTAGKDGSIKIWNFNNGALLGELQNVHGEEVTDILCCKNTFLTGGWSRQIVIYTDSRGVEEEEPPRAVTDFYHTEDILSMALYRSDILAYCMYDGSIVVRNTGCDIVLCKLTSSNCTPKGGGFATLYYSPLANAFPADNTPYSDVPVALPNVNNAHRIANIKKKRKSSVSPMMPVARMQLASQPEGHLDDGEHIKYGCSIDKVLFLNARPNQYNTAILISGGSYGIIRAWSCQGGGMLGQFSVMEDATMNDSVHAMVTDTQNNLLITGDTMGFLNIYDISTYCFNTSAATCHSPNVCHKQKALPFKPPPLKQNFRCHLATITNVELVQKQDLIITTSTDCSIRLWTIQGTYIGTFGQTEIWKVRPDSPDEFAIPDDIRATMTEDQINRQKRKKRKFNPWKSIKNVMTFTHLSSQLNDRGILDMVDNDKTLQISLDCDKSYILGRGYRRTTRPRQPLPPVRVGQECGSILVFSQLDQKNMAIDPAFPCPPNYMKIAGREGLPKFTANGIDKIAKEEKQASPNWGRDEESESDTEPDELIPRSKKFNERNLFPPKSFNSPEICLKNILNVKKAAKRFGKARIQTAEVSE